MLPKLTKMDLKMRPHSHRDPELVENRKHQIRTVNTMVFEGSTFSKKTKNHINFNPNLVGNTFGTEFALGAAKITLRVVHLTPSGTKLSPKWAHTGEGFSGDLEDFGSIFDLWLAFWLKNSSMAPVEGFRVSKLTPQAPKLLPQHQKTIPQKDPSPFSGP